MRNAGVQGALASFKGLALGAPRRLVRRCRLTPSNPR
jgi:hypothetical protein